MTLESRPREAVQNPVKKYSFNLYQSDIDMLRQMAGWAGTNVTQALRGAIATTHFLRQATREGAHIIVEEDDGRRREIVFR
jgi:hypothetical protein